MSRVLATALGLGMAWLIGHLLVAVLWRQRPRDLATGLIHLAAGLGLGIGVLAALDFLWIAATGKASRGIVAVELVVLAVLVVAERKTRQPPAPAAVPPPILGWPAATIVACFIVLALAIVGTLLLRIPDGVWDAIFIWNVHAKLFNAPSPQGWRAVFDPIMHVTHPGYPPLLPAAVALGWTHVGSSIHLVPMTLALAFTGALLALVAGAVAAARSAALGALACVMLAGSPIFLGTAASQYADLPLACYVLLAVALLHRADYEQRGGLYVLAGLAAGMAALTKNEGSLFLVALGAGRLLRLLMVGGRRRQLGQLAWLLAGLGPALGVLLLYKSFAPPNYLVAAQGPAAWSKLVTLPRAQLIVAQWLGELEKPHDMFATCVQRIPTWHWHLVAALALLLLLGLDRRRLVRPLTKWGLGLVALGVLGDLGVTRLATGACDWHWTVAMAAAVLVVALGFDLRRLRRPAFLVALVTLVVVNTGYFFAYLLTPLDLKWQLANSLERLLLHTMPLGIFVAFLAVAPARHEHP